MKFMLMMNAPRGTGDWAVVNWPPEDLKAHINFMKQFAKDLQEAGEWVGGEGLASPGEARVAGDHQAAIAHYGAAASGTTSIPERNYLTTKAARLSAKRA
ncbi:MAG TPA: hypothetical protein VI485_09770 [Vicinamibacterales bacterium]|nr:hypothetical protein [Vicinamibacterales bacterium]